MSFGPACTSSLLKTSYRSLQTTYPRSFLHRRAKIRVVQPKLARFPLATIQQRFNLTSFAVVAAFTDHQRHELNGLISFEEKIRQGKPSIVTSSFSSTYHGQRSISREIGAFASYGQTSWRECRASREQSVRIDEFLFGNRSQFIHTRRGAWNSFGQVIV